MQVFIVEQIHKESERERDRQTTGNLINWAANTTKYIYFKVMKKKISKTCSKCILIYSLSWTIATNVH